MEVDRGFRDSITEMEDLGLNVVLPSFLHGRRQFSSSEANQSRYVTKVRWVVEAVNARIKQFKFFANIIQNSSLPFLGEYLLITCAIINRYQTPVKTNAPDDDQLAERMASLKVEKKQLETVGCNESPSMKGHIHCFPSYQFVEAQGLKRNSSLCEKINHTDIIEEFPILNEKDIIANITCGKQRFLGLFTLAPVFVFIF